MITICSNNLSVRANGGDESTVMEQLAADYAQERKQPDWDQKEVTYKLLALQAKTGKKTADPRAVRTSVKKVAEGFQRLVSDSNCLVRNPSSYPPQRSPVFRSIMPYELYALYSVPFPK